MLPRTVPPEAEGLRQRAGSEAVELATVALLLAAMPAAVEMTVVGPLTGGLEAAGPPVEWMAASM